MIQSAGASIDNSGTISGAGYGIVTQLYYNDETGQAEIRAVGTAVTNSGTIRGDANDAVRSEEHTSELQSLMRISYAVFCLKKKKTKKTTTIKSNHLH